MSRVANVEPLTHDVLDSLKPSGISAGAVELRLNPEAWPAGVDPKASHVSGFHKAVADATTAYAGFTVTQKRNRTNPDLTPQGAFSADVAWADQFLAPIREQLTAVREDRDRTKDRVLQTLTDNLSEPPEDAHTIAMHREIRDALAKIPQESRKLQVMEWTLGGDDEALRAVLTVPAYLTGLKPEALNEIRETVGKRRDPARFALYEQKMQAAEFAERALDGVIRFVEQETRSDARAIQARKEAKERERRERIEADMQARGEFRPEPFGNAGQPESQAY